MPLEKLWFLLHGLPREAEAGMFLKMHPFKQ
jgi:hypothetical protein